MNLNNVVSFVAVPVGVACASVGSCLAWPSSVIEGLQDPAGPWKLNGDESSWVVSLLDLGIVLGSLPAGWLADRLGRRCVMLLATVPLALCWLLLLTAASAGHHLWMLCLARLVGGLGSSAVLVASVMYLSEIAADSLRGTLNTVAAACLNGGLVFSYAIGPYVTFRILAGASLALAFVAVVCLSWVPESPWYFVRRGQRDEAIRALARLRGGGMVDSGTELAQLESALAMEATVPKTAWKHLLAGDRRALAVVLALVVLQALSGAAAMQSYSSITLPSSVGPYEVVIVYGILTLIASLAAAFVVDLVGRKPLLFWASLIQTIALTASAVYYTLLAHWKDMASSSSWWRFVPTVGLLVFAVAYPMGLGTVPNVLQSEMFSATAKGICLPIVLVTFNGLTFFVSKMFEVVSRKLGSDVAFWFFVVDAFVATMFASVALRETKGKTLEQIQRDLNPDIDNSPRRPLGANGRPFLESEPSRATLYSISIESSTGFYEK